MSNYMYAPVEGGDFLGRFGFVRERGEPRPPEFTPQHAELLAELVNAAIECDNKGAVWLNPETDGKGVRIHSMPVEFGGRAVRLVVNDELAVFPQPQRVAA